MTLPEVIFTSEASRALGWALLHSLWQGALVALLLAGVQTLLRGRGANARYAAACAALLLMLLLPAATFLGHVGKSGGAKVDEVSLRTPPRSDAGAETWRTGRPEGRPDGASARAEETPPQRILTARLDPVLPWLSLAWLAGVLGLTARVFGGLMYARRLTRCGNRPLGALWQERLERLSKQLRIRQAVLLLESQMVRVPTTVGWLRPVILLPASALTGLTPAQLELILAHELAHIRRHDYLVNLFQVLTETLLFYHPAAWWVSRQARAEREHACDDLAVAVGGGDAVAYARALTKVERLRSQRPLLAVAADGGKLSGRVLRLIEKSQGQRRPASPLLGLLLVAAFFTSIAYAHGVLSRRKQNPPADSARASATRESAPEGVKQDRAAEERSALAEEMASLVASDDTAGEDVEVRRVALDALGGRAGTVVVMNPKTGRVYAVVNQEWALRRGLKPASTIKLVTGAAGVSDKKLAAVERARALAKAKTLDLTEALARSDNSYFGSVGESVGAERLVEFAREFGLGEATGINYEGESAGIIPASPGGDAYGLGAYGDGVEATPVQLAVLVSSIANGGALVVPRVPRTPQEAGGFDPQVRRRLRIPREHVERLVSGMIAAVKYGTGRAASEGTRKVAGKTGSFVDDKSPVGIFASYAPSDDPRLVVVVVTRGENEKGAAAAGVAGAIYRALGRRA